MRSLPHPQGPALSLCPVVEDHPTAALVSVAHHDTETPVMHGIRITAIQRLSNILRDDRRIEIVPWAFPDAGMVCQWPHAVPIAGMVAANLAEWIWTGGLLCFRSHSRCGHPCVGSANALGRSGETIILFPTTAVCQRRGSRLGRN